MTTNPQEPLKSKLLFCWLSLIGGSFGAHWIYAGRKRFWFYMLFFPLSAFAGWLDTMRYGLMPDERFNADLNPEYPPDTRQTSGMVVVSVALALGLSVTALMSLLAMLFQWFFSGTVA
ncbi:MAG TPA: hypothetical protein VGE55_02560 [Limnobacter sp.]|uniref:hypothetical protein n=1 Tax=Limnobacter sp. TaxID=2003368 RepID=UPI002ED816F8